MRTPQLSMVIVLVALSALFVEITVAQQPPPSRGAEDTIRALEDQERLAVLNRDLDALKRLWSEQLLVNTPSNRVSPNRDVPLGLIQTGVIHYTLFERTIEALRIDGDTAFVMGAETIKPTDKAPQAGQTVRRRFTHVWKRVGGTWRLAARHANVLPPE
jgi:ketosteroid isomerase-like protein